jgi:hypothetical protein
MAREPLLAPLYWPNIWRQQYKIWRYYRDKGASLTDCFVHRYTEIVLDGCQGSANSYAADVFLRSQKRPVHMAHHMHAPAQIIKATKRNIPTLVTIRNPKATVLSLTSRWPYISVRQALKHYISFYKKLEPHRAHFILSPFEATTNHFDIAIQIINQHFGTDFDLISEQVLLEMRERHSPGDSTPESRKRLELKKRKEKELLNPRCKPLIKSAELLYDRLVRHELTV